MADILPECLIQKILCFLSFEEAAKMTILSKAWLQAWLTLPDLKFTAIFLYRNTKIADNIMERYRDGKIPIQKFELSHYVNSSEHFLIIDKWLDIALQNGVKDLIFNAHVHTLYICPIFKITAANSLRELVVSFCDLMHVSLSSGVANCRSLRKLSLSCVTLNDNILQTLLNSCPLIVTFSLEYCRGLEKIELSNLQKIKSISMWIDKNQRVKIEAPTLEHLYFSGFPDEYPMLDIIDAPNLVSLEYLGNQIPMTFIDANLQWSCHPTRFILGSTSKMITRFMDHLMYMKNSSHSTSGGSKGLRSQLKEVKAYKFDRENQSWHLVELESVNLMSLREWERFSFLLDW